MNWAHMIRQWRRFYSLSFVFTNASLPRFTRTTRELATRRECFDTFFEKKAEGFEWDFLSLFFVFFFDQPLSW